MKISTHLAKEIGPFAYDEALREANFGQRVLIRAVPWPLILLIVRVAIELFARWLERRANSSDGELASLVSGIVHETNSDLIARFDAKKGASKCQG